MENMDPESSGIKTRGTILACYQCCISDGKGCISANAIGSWHIWKVSINAETYIQVLEEHILPSFSGKALHVSARQY